jgi:hypothetical protein
LELCPALVGSIQDGNPDRKRRKAASCLPAKKDVHEMVNKDVH